MRTRRAGERNRPGCAPGERALPECLTRFVSGRLIRYPDPPAAMTAPGWIAGPLRDIATALLVAIIVTLVGGQILQAW
ncbi:hypothetical protein [Methylobacterium sp. CM6257]